MMDNENNGKKQQKRPVRYNLYDKLKINISLKAIDIFICVLFALLIIVFLLHFLK